MVNIVEFMMVGMVEVGVVGGVDLMFVLLIGVFKKLVCVLVDL